MKVLLNINLDAMPSDWVPCQGVKLNELDDGSFDLIVTRDLDAAREADERAGALLRRIKGEA
jgi:hypothetical protein